MRDIVPIGDSDPVPMTTGNPAASQTAMILSDSVIPVRLGLTLTAPTAWIDTRWFTASRLSQV